MDEQPTQLSADQIKTEIAKLGKNQQTQQVRDWLHAYLPKFEQLGIPSDSIMQALQVELLERACHHHHKIETGQWFANLGGLLLAAHADGVDLEAGGQIPNHHLSLELLKYAIGRYLGEGGDQSDLRDVLICMIQDLSSVPPPPKPEIQ